MYGLKLYHYDCDQHREIYASEAEKLTNRPQLRLVYSGLSGGLQQLSHQLGDTVQTDNISTIFWADTSDKAVKITLSGDKFEPLVLTDSTENDGIFSWSVPYNFRCGDNYKLEISYCDGSGSITSSNFSIIPAKRFVNIYYGEPNGWFNVDDEITLKPVKSDNFYCWSRSDSKHCLDRYDSNTTLTVPDKDISIKANILKTYPIEYKIQGQNLEFKHGLFHTKEYSDGSGYCYWRPAKSPLTIPIGQYSTGRYVMKMKYFMDELSDQELKLYYHDGLFLSNDTIGAIKVSDSVLTSLTVKHCENSDSILELKDFQYCESDTFFMVNPQAQFVQIKGTGPNYPLMTDWIEFEQIDGMSITNQESPLLKNSLSPGKESYYIANESGSLVSTLYTLTGKELESRSMQIVKGKQYQLFSPKLYGEGIYLLSLEINGIKSVYKVTHP